MDDSRVVAARPAMPDVLRRHAPALAAAAVGAALAFGLFVLRWNVIQMAAGLLGACVAVIFLLRPLWGFYALVSTFSAEHLLGLSELLTLTKVLGFVVLGAWLVDWSWSRRYVVPRSWVLLFGPALLASAVMSLSVARRPAAGMERIGTILLLNLLLLMAATIVRAERHVERVGSIFIATALVPVVFIFQQVGPGGVVNEEEFLYNRNAMGLFLAMAVPFLLYFMRRASFWKKGLLAGLTGLYAVAEGLSYSRGGMVAFTSAVLMSWALVARGQRLRVLLAVSAVIVVVTVILPQGVWERAGSIVPAVVEGRDTMGERYRLWDINLRMIRDHPWLGVGPGNYLLHYMEYSGVLGLIRGPLHAHNAYLEVTVEMGLVGGAVFVLLLLAAFHALWVARRAARRAGRRHLADLAACLGTVMVVYCISGLKGGVEYYKYLWVVLGMSAAMVAMAKRSAEAAPPAP
jgi:O-antigen ligase